MIFLVKVSLQDHFLIGTGIMDEPKVKLTRNEGFTISDIVSSKTGGIKQESLNLLRKLRPTKLFIRTTTPTSIELQTFGLNGIICD